MNARRYLSFLAVLVLVSGSSLAARADDADEAGPPADSLLGPPVTIAAESWAQVEVVSPVPVELQRRKNAQSEWVYACTSPCNRDLPLGDEYRVVLGNSSPGDPFELQATSGRKVRLKVSPASTAGTIGGSLLVFLGVTVVAVSIAGIVSFSGPHPCETQDACGVGAGLRELFFFASIVGTAVGTGTAAVGALVVWDSGAHVTQTSKPLTGFVREPTWGGPRVASSGAPAFIVPLGFAF